MSRSISDAWSWLSVTSKHRSNSLMITSVPIHDIGRGATLSCWLSQNPSALPIVCQCGRRLAQPQISFPVLTSITVCWLAVVRVQYAVPLEPHRLHRYLPKHVGARLRPTQLSRYQLWIHLSSCIHHIIIRSPRRVPHLDRPNILDEHPTGRAAGKVLWKQSTKFF